MNDEAERFGKAVLLFSLTALGRFVSTLMDFEGGICEWRLDEKNAANH